METQNLFAKLLNTLQPDLVDFSLCGYTAAFDALPCDMQDLRDARRKHIAAFEAWSQQAELSAAPLTAKLEDDDVLGNVKACR